MKFTRSEILANILKCSEDDLTLLENFDMHLPSIIADLEINNKKLTLSNILDTCIRLEKKEWENALRRKTAEAFNKKDKETVEWIEELDPEKDMVYDFTYNRNLILLNYKELYEKYISEELEMTEKRLGMKITNIHNHFPVKYSDHERDIQEPDSEDPYIHCRIVIKNEKAKKIMKNINLPAVFYVNMNQGEIAFLCKIKKSDLHYINEYYKDYKPNKHEYRINFPEDTMLETNVLIDSEWREPMATVTIPRYTPVRQSEINKIYIINRMSPDEKYKKASVEYIDKD